MRTRHEWTPEEIAVVGTMSDSAVAKQIGVSQPTVSAKRRQLGRPPAWSSAQHESSVVRVDSELAAKLDELAPLLAARFRQSGLPIKHIERWQVIELAVNELLIAARKSKARQLYVVEATPEK